MLKVEQNKQQNKNINLNETRKLSAFQILIVKCFCFIPGPMGTTLSSKRSWKYWKTKMYIFRAFMIVKWLTFLGQSTFLNGKIRNWQMFIFRNKVHLKSFHKYCTFNNSSKTVNNDSSSTTVDCQVVFLTMKDKFCHSVP